MPTPLKRQIGFSPQKKPKKEPAPPKLVKTAREVPQKAIEAAKTTVQPTEAPKKEPQNDLLERSDRLIAWLKAHPYIKWSSLVTDLGGNKGNFSTEAMNPRVRPRISAGLLEKLEKALKEYGYK